MIDFVLANISPTKNRKSGAKVLKAQGPQRLPRLAQALKCVEWPITQKLWMGSLRQKLSLNIEPMEKVKRGPNNPGDRPAKQRTESRKDVGHFLFNYDHYECCCTSVITVGIEKFDLSLLNTKYASFLLLCSFAQGCDFRCRWNQGSEVSKNHACMRPV